jgi:hypothetical protein
MAPNVSVEESWEPEPELRDTPPRRLVEGEFPDMNKPPIGVLLAVGGALLLLGFAIIFVQSAKLWGLLSGLLLIGGGLLMLIIAPNKEKKHQERIENLVSNGLPRMARILGSQNLSGSPYKRTITYQYVNLEGEMKHRSVNVDDRALPRRIPSNVTILMDVKTGDVELYCVLPYRAMPRTATITNSDPLVSVSSTPEMSPMQSLAAAMNILPSTPATANGASFPQPAPVETHHKDEVAEQKESGVMNTLSADATPVETPRVEAPKKEPKKDRKTYE